MNIEATGVLIQRRDGKVLILHRKKGTREGGKFGLAGGVVRPLMGITKTAVYKAFSEAGVSLQEEELKLIDKFEFPAEGNDIKYYAYLAKIDELNPKIILDKEGHDGYEWINTKEALQRKDLMVGMYPILEKFNEQNK